MGMPDTTVLTAQSTEEATPAEMVTITKELYTELLADQTFLEALRNAIRFGHL